MRLCVFCGRRVTTKEHAWPQWALESLYRPGARPGGAVTMNLRGSISTYAAHSSRRGPRVKHLCTSCNSGWMSRLETAVQPIMRPMMRDNPILLDVDAQRVLTAWGIKTAMVFQCLLPPERWFYSKPERTHLLTHLAPPDNRVVAWLGRHTDPGIANAQVVRLSVEPNGVPIDGFRSGDGEVTTLTLAHFVLQLFSVKRHPDHETASYTYPMQHGNWDESLVRIWPPSPTVHWPPAWSFDESGLKLLGGRFGRPDPAHRPSP
jgi:hypothetical protein